MILFGVGVIFGIVVVGTTANLSIDTVVKDYHDQLYLDSKQKYHLDWNIDWHQKMLFFKITVRTNGWVGFGFSKNGLMEDADMVIAGVGPNNSPYIFDYHTDCHRNLISDNQQDWNLLSSVEAGGTTSVQISRLIDTCDSNDYPITEDLVYIIWAFGENGDKIDYHHQNRGSYHLYLLDPVVHPAPSSNSLPRWSVTNGLFTIPPRGTSYWCSIHKAPVHNRKRHLIQFQAVLENPHDVAVNHVHHFVLWRCFAPPGVDPRTIFEPLVSYKGEECYFAEKNLIPINLCRYMIYVWALGGRPLILPDHVGIPFASSPDEYYMLETHYNNPELVDGITFTSGVEAVYTDRLRRQDGGTFMVDHDLFSFVMIPPGSQNYKIPMQCSSECTSVMFPREGVDVFAIHSHTHISGKKIRLRQFRNGNELPWLFKDDNYNYLFQNPRPLQMERKLLPRDHITLECTYDNTWTNVSTVAGPRAVDEMCLSVIYHTVPIPYSWCSSLVPEERLFRFFGVRNVTWDLQTQERVVTSPLLLKGDTMAHVMDDLTQWTQPLRDSITKATLTFPQVVECPVIIPGSTPPDQATLGYSYRMLMGTYDTPNVDLTSSIMSVGPQTDSQLSRVRTCPST